MRHIRSVPGRITAIDAAEAGMDDITSMPPHTAVIGVSQSGYTKATHSVLADAMENGIQVMSVVNIVGLLISRTTKLGVYSHAGHERAVPSTKSFTAQATTSALVALWFRELQNKTHGSELDMETEALRQSMMRLPMSFGMALRSHPKCKEVAARLNDKEHCFVLGKGYAEPIAYEGALKLKEMGYLHAEEYSGGALKHGPFALIENKENGKFEATPIIMIILDDEHGTHMRTAAEEVKARGAELIIITDKPSLARDLDPSPIIIPTNGPMTALVPSYPFN